ncbi:hypothetical protein [Zhongshania sp. BJYM1]|uniref:hypothetical protein n=1 Tax=Zhongshania aquatica TaxID=2965069 RepID=UPI0022B48D51|nr:hypothetical protein [Marortus sp. BJYM1]
MSANLNTFIKLAIINDMTESRFDLILTGNLAPGVSRDAAISKLAALFKRSIEQVEPLLSGKASRVRKDLNETELQRYQQAFNAIGVVTKVLPAAPKLETSTSNIPSSTPHLSLCPNGTPVLSDDERQHPPVAAPETAHLSVVELGQNLSDNGGMPPLPAPDTEHLSLAATGTALLPETRSAVTPPVIQTSQLSLCGTGTPLLDPRPKVEYRIPNTEHLDLL